jgi:lipocalin
MDWKQIAGLWYEHARVPSWFEPTTAMSCTAQYTFSDSTHLTIVNTSYDSFGTPLSVKATATVDPAHPNNTLNVSFFPSIVGKYIVLDHDTSFSYLIVGDQQSLIWLLTRVPTKPSNALWQRFMNVAKQVGINPVSIQATPQVVSIQSKLF